MSVFSSHPDLPKDTYRPEDENFNSQRSVLMLTADNTEDIEFFYPYYRFIEEGFRVDVATPSGGAFRGKQGLGLKDSKKVSEVDASDYDLLYIPGGKAPAALKKYEEALALTQAFVAEGKPVAAVCHGPQILAAADVIRGRKIACWPEVENEIREAGASYLNEETVVDGPFVTARWPGDLPSHVKHTLEVLDKYGQSSRHAPEAA
ncbi:MAG: type 1 glutamine amidotransferase [Pseudomonadota bacterium]|nr:type 1 glutamine amidotransferase [Pseudomonadota bacterium]